MSPAEEFRSICPGAEDLNDGGLRFVYLPQLTLPPKATPETVDALLCLDRHGSYPTRLFFATQVARNPAATGPALNWNGNARILERNWVAFSWDHVQNTQHPVSILTAHLDALR